GRREYVGHKGEREGDDRAATYSQKSSSDDELTHSVQRNRQIPCRAAREQRDHKNSRAPQIEVLPAIEIRKFCKHRHRNRRREQKRCRRPGIACKTVQASNCTWHCRDGDRLIHGRRQQREYYAAQGKDQLSAAEIRKR